jgi:multiple sugar transport system permease protein/putative aldouronate transport system permease protein
MAGGTAVSLALTFMAAYPLSRRDLRGRGWLTFFMVFTMMFSGGLIPYYLLVRSLGMLDTPWAMIMPRAIGVWNVMIMRAYLQANIPHELLEASQLDGCSDVRFMVQVVAPLAKPVFAVIALYYAVAQWNTFFHALIFLTRKDLMPLQMFLRDILIQNEQRGEMLDIETAEMMQSLSELLKYSVIVVASAPVLAIYPFVQRYFVKGVMIGALKG